MTIFSKVRPEHIKKGINWAIDIAVMLFNKWRRRYER
jgi:hypothetical protein